MDVLEREWDRTSAFVSEEPGSPKHTEYIFWRHVSVIWTCATIEAFVNEEGAAWVGAQWYKKTIERGRIDEKILLVYALKYRKLLPIDYPPLKRINQLFQRRGELVHPKATSPKNGAQEHQSPPTFDPADFREFRKVFWGLTSLFQSPGEGEETESQNHEQDLADNETSKAV
jgi:hypothetical protein